MKKKPIIQNSKIKTQYFESKTMGDDVRTYVDQNGITRFTGMDGQGATTFKDKAHYFATRILFRDPEISSRIFSFPLDLFVRDFLSVQTSENDSSINALTIASHEQSDIEVNLPNSEGNEITYVAEIKKYHNIGSLDDNKVVFLLNEMLQKHSLNKDKEYYLTHRNTLIMAVKNHFPKLSDKINFYKL